MNLDEFEFLKKWKSTEPGEAVVVSRLDGKKLGPKLDFMLQNRIVKMQEWGTPIG